MVLPDAAPVSVMVNTSPTARRPGGPAADGVLRARPATPAGTLADVNVFVSPERTASALTALPPGIVATDDDRALLERDGQARLWWENTPVDVFLNTTHFHEQVATRVHLEPFAGEQLPFLACHDLAVFKAFFDRTKDWADLEAMAAAGSLDVSAVAGVLAGFLGAGDDRIEHLLSLGR